MRTFFLYAVVELAVLAALTWSVGIGWTLLILLATSVIGVALAGSQVKKQILKLQRTRTDPQGAVA
ncbi:MAG: FxsA family protein, partial [Mycolicibacterium aromaticivorans]|nr:FxsA family protein [Mycolicibacterium aromaticivorans]